jgi:hypothetical protein
VLILIFKKFNFFEERSCSFPLAIYNIIDSRRHDDVDKNNNNSVHLLECFPTVASYYRQTLRCILNITK